MQMTTMNNESIFKKLKELEGKGSVFGLDSIKNLCFAAGNPQNSLKFIHIAGTNGKGSLQAFLYSVLKESGLKAGCFTSPAVTDPFEIISINGENIAEADYLRLAEYALSLCENEGINATLFEVQTAAAFLYFKEQNCDVVILEAGLGGELDATNVVTTTILSVIASVGLDHCGVLGNTVYEIAKAKAGIIKESVPTVTAETGEALTAIKEKAEEKNAPLYIQSETPIVREENTDRTVFGLGFHKDIEIKLLGKYQLKNAALALKAIDILKEKGFKISEENIKSGMKKARHKGRMEIISKSPLFIIDGAHNPHGAKALRESFTELFGNKKAVMIMGILKDKDYEGIVTELMPIAKTVFAVTPPVERGLKAETLAEVITKKDVSCKAAKIKEAADAARKEAGADGIVLACGSLSYLKEVINYGKGQQNFKK